MGAFAPGRRCPSILCMRAPNGSKGDEVGAAYEPYGVPQPIEWNDPQGLQTWYARLIALRHIHKALRHFMTDTLVRVGRLDIDDADEMSATLAQLETLLTLCTRHIEHENDFLHTAIEARQRLALLAAISLAPQLTTAVG